MRHWQISFLAGAAALLLGAGAAGAQTLELPRSRQGYYLAFGGYGVGTQVWQDGERFALAGGRGSAFRMGQMLTRRLGLGLAFDFGSTQREARTALLGGIALEGQWELARNLAARGGVGLSVVVTEDRDDPDAGQGGGVGAGYFVGIGYDWFPWKSRLTGGFAITPVAQVRYTPADSTRALTALVGVELTWWTGLPRNQLELPEADAYDKRP